MAPHSSTLFWKIPWTEEPGGLQSMGSLRVGQDWMTSLSFSLSCIGEGNGNPLQCSCLENPRDGGACWAAVYGVAQSRTRLKRLSSSSNPVPNKPIRVIFPTMSFHYFCISALQIRSLIPFFQIPHIYINILYLFFSLTHFSSSHISNFFNIAFFVMVICDQWSLMLLLQFAQGSDDG